MSNQLADCLPRLGGQKDTINLPKLHAYQITSQLCARGNSLNQTRIATQEDDELALLKQTITLGCPSIIKEAGSEISRNRKYFFTRQTFASFQHGSLGSAENVDLHNLVVVVWENIDLHNITNLINVFCEVKLHND